METLEGNKKFTKPITVCVLALISCFLWGSAFPCVKIGYELFEISASDTASVLLFAGLRFSLAGILVITFGSIIERRVLLPKKSSLWKILLLCLAQTVVQYAFFYVGLSRTTGVKASIIEAMNVFVAIVVAAFIFRQEKFTFLKAVGCMLGMAGIVVVNLNGLSFEASLTGEGFIFISTVSYAFSACMLKLFSKSEDTFVLSGYQFFFGGIILSVVGLAFGGKLAAFSFAAGAMLLYLALISSVAYTLWGVLLKYNSPSRVAVFGFMNPVFGVILSALLLKETIDPLLCVFALLLTSAGIVLINVWGEKDFFGKK